MTKSIRKVWAILLSFFTAEFVLTHFTIPNGGGLILFRSLWTAAWISFFALLTRNILASSSHLIPRLSDLAVAPFRSVSTFGAVFAGVYALFYARFASQWTYLGHVYNQIKRVEASGSKDRGALAEWKAGFLEDAEEVQLATKPMFASVIKAWGSEAEVKRRFVKHTLGGQKRLNALLEKVDAVCLRKSESYD